MLHAAAMVIGLSAVWLLFLDARNAAAAIGVSASVVLLIWRLGGVRANAFAHAPGLVALAVARAGAVARGAARTMRAVLAADVTLRPALVRIRTRAAAPAARAALVGALSAAPGAVVVDGDGDSLLLHVLDEDKVDAGEIGAAEARVRDFIEGRAP